MLGKPLNFLRVVNAVIFGCREDMSARLKNNRVALAVEVELLDFLVEPLKTYINAGTAEKLAARRFYGRDSRND